MERKTKKYYRDKINKSYSDAKQVFIEALEKYAPKSEKTYDSYVRVDVSNNWNGVIEGFSVTRSEYNYDKHAYIRKRKHIYWIDVYMQGDDTDSSQSLQLEEVLRKGKFQISFEETFSNGYSHKPIAEFTTEHIYDAMKIFAKEYLK